MSTATDAARSIVQGLVDAGVEHVVLCPGSRSAPLAYALAAADEAGLVQVHVRIDERSAGFTALGVGKASGIAAVVTTSGTAVANLLPAVWEAHHSQVPLLLLTADRPRRLRGTWANQTTPLQAGVFAEAALEALDVEASEGVDLRAVVVRLVGAAWGHTGVSGPVHLDVGFDDPLVPEETTWAPHEPRSGPGSPWRPVETTAVPGEGTLLVAGDGAGTLAPLVEAAGTPWCVEPSAGLAPLPGAVAAGRVLLGLDALGGRVRRVLVAGRPSLTRPVSRLLAREDVEVVLVGRHAALPGPGREVQRLDAVAVATAGGWREGWQRAGRAALGAVHAVLDRSPALAGPHVARTVAAARSAWSPAEPWLFVGASSIVRDLDLVLDHTVPAPRVHASRGLAGIDGSLSTAGGLALGGGAPVRALVGDLTFLHDTNGLLVGPTEARPPVQVVVANDDGGSIFGLLEHGEDRYAGVHERYFATPHGVDLAALCRAHGVPHRLVTTEAELGDALAAWDGGAMEVVEARTARRGARALQAEVARAAREAALAAL
ncbi:2-succinyl-5-enolpyruvyl-6-hydroxy-3-cyclohexene-1-carboxylic-acid synthase [Aquipuribacter sp. SD81]|uniref:2-succinyl-5-enolpyruvyl-6-hydroxy-3- cyclohexene-1-carboxylic-acid synthase n=1 Tax=Aquipuribacter sp. SD81 TaxID=3127703 RepID=UPI003015E984